MPRLTAALGQGVDIFHLTIAAPTREDFRLSPSRRGSSCCVSTRAWSSSWPLVTVAPGGRAGQPPSARWSRSVRSGPTGAAGPGSATTAAGSTLRARPRSDQRLYEWHLRVRVRAVRRPEAAVLRDGEVERNVLFDAHRDRADRGAHVPDRGKWPASGGRAAGRGPGQCHPGVGPILLPCCGDQHPAGPRECCCGRHRPRPGCC